ncbi:MAG: hypothetical protein IKZ87_08925 [Actinomycetaceae bacterium]|nr:hypothetical protein [Actinomycetaceae bacterium]
MFSLIDAELRDGVSSPGHRLYSVCYEGQTIGGAWLEVDGSVARVRSVVLDSEARGFGHCRAALDALVLVANMEGVRQIQTTLMHPSLPRIKELRDMGMKVISTNYVCMPEAVRVSVLQNA